MSIKLTEAAASQIKETIKGLIEDGQLTSANETWLRVAVKGGGCSGFQQSLDLVSDPPGERDEEIEVNGVKIVCDQTSMLYLTGAEIDFVSDGPLRQGFTFKNPNATSSCGCGKSFSA